MPTAVDGDDFRGTDVHTDVLSHNRDLPPSSQGHKQAFADSRVEDFAGGHGQTQKGFTCRA